jgi:hypothetical protein
LEDCSLGGVPLNTKDKNIFKNSKDNSSAISFLEETRFIIQNFTVFMTKKFTNLITIFPMETYYYLQPFPKTDKLCTQQFGELELTLDLYEEKLPAWIKAKFACFATQGGICTKESHILDTASQARRKCI